MRNRIFSSSRALPLVAATVLLLGAATLISATKAPYTAQQKAYYADANLINFVRPGLVVRILSAEIGAEGVIRARVKFTDPQGLPLDREGVTTPGAINASLIAATIPRGRTQYTAYTTRDQTSPITNRRAVQASSDSGGAWQRVGDGEYVYTFATRAPIGFDRNATHTVGVYANRNLEEFDLGVNLFETTFDFVPDGSTVALRRDVIRTESCNRCHDSLQAHGNTGRTTMQGCVLCHSPQTTDPDTGNTMDFAVMIHRIHRGSSLPSVEAGEPYRIIGFRQSVHDYSNVVYSVSGEDSTRQCATCHEPNRGATQHEAWLKPSRVACGSCHDDVNFATGENHADLPQVSDSQCARCHAPEGELEFDLSILGSHTTPRFSRELTGVVFEILEVRDTNRGMKPVVTFTLKDKKGAPLSPSGFNVLALTLAGPASDYNRFIREDASGAQGSGDRYTYTFSEAIPAAARGTWSVGIEGRRSVNLLAGTRQEMSVNDAGANVVRSFSVDGTAVAERRKIVDLAKCNACHGSLSFHGSLRNQIEYCVLCHNPAETDADVRPADKMPAESIDFRTMIHRIHTGAELGRDYTVYGFRSSVHNYNNVHYPGRLENCAGCHTGDSQQLPLSAGLSQVDDPRGFLNPIGPESAACTSCHSSVAAASHALANTTRLGESCAACHGPNRDFSVDRSHAR